MAHRTYILDLLSSLKSQNYYKNGTSRQKKNILSASTEFKALLARRYLDHFPLQKPKGRQISSIQFASQNLRVFNEKKTFFQQAG